jgi:hypothetical protein
MMKPYRNLCVTLFLKPKGIHLLKLLKNNLFLGILNYNYKWTISLDDSSLEFRIMHWICLRE